MQRHIKSRHPLLAPTTKCTDDNEEPSQYDPAIVERAAYELVGRDLDNFSCLDRKGMRAFLKSLVPGKSIGGRHALTDAVHRLVSKAHDTIKHMVDKAKKDNAKFSVSADAWKSKGRKRRHYHCIFASWVDADWQLKEVCIGAVEVGRPRDWKAYKNETLSLLSRFGLGPDDIFAAVCDHEGSIRKGFAACGFSLVGCCCHGLQLPMQHVVPPIKQRKRKRKRASSPSSTSASSTSSSGTSSGTASEARTPAADSSAAPRPHPRSLESTDPERVAIRKELQVLLERPRKLARRYYNNEDDYNELETIAKDNSFPFRRFSKEATTRFSSTFDHMTGHLYMDRALEAHQLSRAGLPPKLDGSGCFDLQHVCGVLMPVKLATKAMESTQTSHRAGLYRPTVVAVTGMMQESRDVPLPQGSGPYGPQKAKKFIKSGELRPLAKRIKAFLHRDIQQNFDKHLSKNGGKLLLGVCSYLDPRFKNLGFLNAAEREEVKTKARSMLTEMVSHFEQPGALEAGRNEAAVLAQEKARVAAEAIEQARRAAEAAGDIGLLEFAGVNLISPTKACGKAGGKKKKLQHVPVSASAEAPSSAAAGMKARDDAEVVGFTLRSMYKPDEPEPTGTSKVFSIHMRMKKEWDLYDKEPETDLDIDPASWWQSKLKRELLIPHIAILARACLGIPGSSSDLERAFSHASRAITPKRARLSPEHGCDTIFLHENILKGNV